jgi:hypothetical protein
MEIIVDPKKQELSDDQSGYVGNGIVVSEEFISHFIGNISAMANGRSLVDKGQFTELFLSEDESLVFGTCRGSGKEPYHCSVDFIDAERPIPRCTCPSRQVPCKHVAGLLYARLQGVSFSTAPLPTDIVEKREKARGTAAGEAKSARKAVASKPKTVSSSDVKKFYAQLEGIAIAEKILHNIVLTGLYGIDDKNRDLYHEQIKELGNYYILGIQAGFRELFYMIDAERTREFTEAIGQINYLHALLAKSRSHTEQKLIAYEQVKGAPEAASPAALEAVRDATLHSSIEEQMGYIWKLTELEGLGLFVENARLLQVGFESFDDKARSQWEDRGVWLSLDGSNGGVRGSGTSDGATGRAAYGDAISTGAIYLTRNFRPYKAQQHVHQEDSFSSIVETDLYVYQAGDRNPRVRWERLVTRDVTGADLAAARNSGAHDFAAVIKAVKNQIRSPLADKNPLFALRVARLGINAEHGLSVFDERGVRLPLWTDDDFAWLLARASREQAEGNTLICRFNQDMKTGILWGIPLSLITTEAVLRFTF